MEHIKKCEHCGAVFTAHHGLVRFCSPQCRQNKVLANLREANAARLERRCVVCGKIFKPHRGTAKYCSPQCAIKEHTRVAAERRIKRRAMIAAMPEAERKVAEYAERIRYQARVRNEKAHQKNAWRGISSDCLLGVTDAVMTSIGDEVFGDLAFG